MSNDQSLQSPLKSKYVIITDPKILEMIRKEEEEALKNKEEVLYIAPNETDETYDQEIISGSGHDLKLSSETVGQLRPIEVAIWFDDPNKKSQNSTLRIHRRIINGRHRYKADPLWRREYYDFSGFVKTDDITAPAVEYNLAKGHFDMQKKATKGERVVWTRNMCELGMKKGISKTDCCKWIVSLAREQGISNKDSITDACEDQFKDMEMRNRKLGKTFELKGVDTKEIKKLKKVAGEKYQLMEATKIKLETENFQLQKEIIGMREDNTKKVKVTEDLQQQLRLITNIQQEHKCSKCGTLTEMKVDASSGKVMVSNKK